MTLDFVRLAPRMEGLIEGLLREQDARVQRLDRARRLLEPLCAGELQAALVAASNTHWLLAEPDGASAARVTLPGLRGPYAALATDGSSIDVNRHASAACFLLNIGHACMDYGDGYVDLGSRAELEFASDRLLRVDQSNASKESVMTGNLLDAYRTALELLRLAELASEYDGASPLVALLDGQLVLWGIKESELSSSAASLIFEDGVLAALDRLRSLAQSRRLVVASYISRPASREVTNSLRIAACPRDGGADCRDCPRHADGSRPCDDVAGGSDGDLFDGYLAEGERSAIFRRRAGSSDLVNADRRYEVAGHGLRFCYLRLPAGETARLEMPEWVAADGEAVDLLQAAIVDQCGLGGGYPVVLQEAHEQAVIDGADRRTFAALVDRQLELRGTRLASSGKALSKQRRAI
jgi:hypothetical protein